MRNIYSKHFIRNVYAESAQYNLKSNNWKIIKWIHLNKRTPDQILTIFYLIFLDERSHWTFSGSMKHLKK